MLWFSVLLSPSYSVAVVTPLFRCHCYKCRRKQASKTFGQLVRNHRLESRDFRFGVGQKYRIQKKHTTFKFKVTKNKKQKNTKWKLFISSQKKTEGLIWFSHNIHVRHQFTFCHPMICESPCWARWLCSVLIQCSDLHLFICFHLDSAFVFFPSSTSEEGAT